MNSSIAFWLYCPRVCFESRRVFVSLLVQCRLNRAISNRFCFGACNNIRNYMLQRQAYLASHTQNVKHGGVSSHIYTNTFENVGARWRRISARSALAISSKTHPAHDETCFISHTEAKPHFLSCIIYQRSWKRDKSKSVERCSGDEACWQSA